MNIYPDIDGVLLQKDNKQNISDILRDSAPQREKRTARFSAAKRQGCRPHWVEIVEGMGSKE